MMTREQEPKTQRKPRASGVRMGFQAFCRDCGWNGAWWMGEESRRNAYAELRWHKNAAHARNPQ